MGRSVGFKCECGAYPRYERTAEGMAAMNCNGCGWYSDTREKWDPNKHERVSQKPESRSIGWVIFGWFLVLGYIVLFGALGGISGCTVGVFMGKATKFADPGMWIGSIIGLWLGIKKVSR